MESVGRFVNVGDHFARFENAHRAGGLGNGDGHRSGRKSNRSGGGMSRPQAVRRSTRRRSRQKLNARGKHHAIVAYHVCTVDRRELFDRLLEPRIENVSTRFGITLKWIQHEISCLGQDALRIPQDEDRSDGTPLSSFNGQLCR